jgi:hypothetical protein
MQTFKPASIIVLAAFLTTSCGDMGTHVTTTGPTMIGAEAPVVSATQSTVHAQPIGNPFCPTVAPFIVPFNIVVSVNGGVSLFITSFSLRFVDTSGHQAPAVTLPAPLPTTQFGTALVDARSGTTFPLTLGIGCGTGSTGTITVTVVTVDATGRQSSAQTTVIVR